MREATVTLAGREIRLAATFGAADEIAKRIADPLLIAREAAVEAGFAAARISYEPKWRPDVQTVPMILHIGAKAAGETLSLKEMQDLAFEHGLIEAMALAIDYIAMIVTPQSDQVEPKKGEASSGE